MCAVFISASFLVRGALTAMGWLHAFPYRYVVVGDFDSGLAAAFAELDRATLPRPDAAALARLRSASLTTLAA